MYIGVLNTIYERKSGKRITRKLVNVQELERPDLGRPLGRFTLVRYLYLTSTRKKGRRVRLGAMIFRMNIAEIVGHADILRWM